ncbi:uncharacterized protein [Diadema antillarum]|uniref:uncharacterized protein isoform X1 n=1 Tax=Diadema antillarum TaxID=105358 RepID=UPI003A89B330
MAEESAEDLSPVGITLTSESCSCHSDSNQDENLGFILVNLETTLVCDLRNAINRQLEMVPSSYKFLTKQGWPVRPKQEMLIKGSHLVKEETIRIQCDYGDPKVGVVSESGLALGFVFMSSLQLTINRLRHAITAQSKDCSGDTPSTSSSLRSRRAQFQDSNRLEHKPSAGRNALGSIPELNTNHWRFLDRNGWPINLQQEATVTILDIIVHSSVRVRIQSLAVAEVRGQMVHEESVDRAASTDLTMTPPSKMQRIGRTPTASSLDSSFSYSQPHQLPPFETLTDVDSPFSKQQQQSAKQILISYVRAEATQYALDLKNELEALQFSVYLDVHEIFCGTDWQDSLNYAVSNCEVFVPLVTPRYGETQWTNREVKLADVLGKYIVPVSFLDSWPPRCLAIQFATTQFIHWRKPKAGEPTVVPHSPTKEVTDDAVTFQCYTWDRKDVLLVATDIGRRCRQKAEDMPNGIPAVKRGKTFSLGENVILNEGRESGKQLLVISTHPKQMEFSGELKELFEREGYDVWQTTELLKLGGTDVESDSTLILTGDDEMVHTEGSIPASNPATLFQEKVDEAAVVIFVLSKAFAESATCKGQVFYCEQRKRVVPLCYEDFEMPGWLSMLIGTSTFENVQRADYKNHLLARISQACDPSTLDYEEDIAKETQLALCVEFVCKNLPDSGCVYIAGGTRFYYDKSEDICKAIGASLAKLPKLTLITGGFFGVGEEVSRSFYEERRKARMEPKVWHILPKKEERDCTAQARQKEDKTFEGPPFGKTLYCGDSVRQRETIVSKVFDICIIIEGGPGAAHEAEEFAWSDHTVIPIKCTGGAAGGKFKVPHKIFELPPGVAREDWQLLGNKAASAEEIGEAVARIVRSLQEGVVSQLTYQKSVCQRPGLVRGKSISLMDRS